MLLCVHACHVSAVHVCACVLAPHLSLEVVGLDDADGGEGVTDALVGRCKVLVAATLRSSDGLRACGVRAAAEVRDQAGAYDGGSSSSSSSSRGAAWGGGGAAAAAAAPAAEGLHQLIASHPQTKSALGQAPQGQSRVHCSWHQQRHSPCLCLRSGLRAALSARCLLQSLWLYLLSPEAAQ